MIPPPLDSRLKISGPTTAIKIAPARHPKLYIIILSPSDFNVFSSPCFDSILTLTHLVEGIRIAARVKPATKAI